MFRALGRELLLLRGKSNQKRARRTFRMVLLDIPREGTRREAVGACTTSPTAKLGPKRKLRAEEEEQSSARKLSRHLRKPR